MTFIISEPCIDILDKACLAQCPVDSIYEGEHMMYIHPDECIECGACEPVCPQGAIFFDEELPEEWSEFAEANVQFFETLGSPGGAANVGKSSHDARHVLKIISTRGGAG